MDLDPKPATGLAKSLIFARTKEELFYTHKERLQVAPISTLVHDNPLIPTSLTGHRPGNSKPQSGSCIIPYIHGSSSLSAFMFECGKHSWKIEVEDKRDNGACRRFRIICPDLLVTNHAIVLARITYTIENTLIKHTEDVQFSTQCQEFDIIIRAAEHPSAEGQYKFNLCMTTKKFYSLAK